MELISDFFLKALKNYFKNAKWGDQNRIALSAGISPKVLNNILAGRNYGSEEHRRSIAKACGYSGRAYDDFLDIGRRLLAGEDPADYALKRPKDIVDIMTQGLSTEQTKLLQAYRELLLIGGEAVETVSDSIRNLAEKKIPGQNTAIYQKK